MPPSGSTERVIPAVILTSLRNVIPAPRLGSTVPDTISSRERDTRRSTRNAPDPGRLAKPPRGQPGPITTRGKQTPRRTPLSPQGKPGCGGRRRPPAPTPAATTITVDTARLNSWRVSTLAAEVTPRQASSRDPRVPRAPREEADAPVRSDAETRHAILRNARAHERARLRTLAQKNWPELGDDELEDKIRELEVAKLREAGRRGRATQHDQARIGRAWAALRPDVEDRLEDLLAIVRSTNLDTQDEAS